MRPIVVFPEPLSPTRPRPAGPGGTLSETPSTATDAAVPDDQVAHLKHRSAPGGVRRGTAASSSACTGARAAERLRYGPRSTTSPSCMIATVSQIPDTTARSWLMKRAARDSSARRPGALPASRPGRSRPARWSARRRAAPRRGAPRRARSRPAAACPPDSWRGVAVQEVGGERTCASPGWPPPWPRLGHPVQPQRPVARAADRNTGLNAVAGLWKIAAICRPRISRSSRWDRPVSSAPSSLMLPRTRRPRLRQAGIASVVMDLPEPLSPAIPASRPRRR